MERAGGQPVRIGVDGYNLALEQGTGIATYSRNLTLALKAAGAQVDVLYGRNIPPPGLLGRARRADAELIREIGFFDPAPLVDIQSAWSGVGWGLRSLWPARASEVPIRGGVVSDDFHDRLPAFDRILNSRNLFVLAHNHFHVWGRLMSVRMPNPPQVMHWTYPIPIELVGSKNIYTVHDLIPLRLPHTTLDHKRRYLKLVKLIGRRADQIVTVSETSKADILEVMGVPEAKVFNTFQAVDLPSSAAAASPAASSLGFADKGYFLFFGAIEPKKNVGRIIEAFLAANVDAPLLIVGKKAWKSDLELRLLPLAQRARAEGGAKRRPPGRTRSANKSGKEPRILQLDYVSRSMLTSLIRGAKAVVFPSIYEGFGLPVLEAMQLGTPVITSNRSSLPEVAGEAALLVDPYDPQAIAAAVRRMDTEVDLRRTLSARGRERAELFSQALYQERLRTLYRRIGISL
jgi:glycosyltransferase involved in cell wall biosynthesis